MGRPSKYPVEFRERAVRMGAAVRPRYGSQWAAIRAVARELGIGAPETVRTWMRRAEIDAGHRPGMTSEQAAELARLKRESAEPVVEPVDVLGAGDLEVVDALPGALVADQLGLEQGVERLGRRLS